MGGSSSKEDEEENNVYDRKYIAWDQHGNMRYGLEHPVERKRQLKEILEKDFVDEEEGKVWYIMSSAWIASWLAYVHFARDTAPCPGPCRNDHLIQWDYTQNAYVGRFGLFMAKSDRAGDYRRVSAEVWHRFKEYYPESGPTITMEYKAAHKRESGEFDPAFWTIVDPPAPPADRGNKKKKKKFLAISMGMKAKDKKGTAKAAAAADEEAVLQSSEESKDDLPSHRPSAAGISSMLTKSEPKAASLSANYAKEEKGQDKTRYSTDENLAKRRESFFEDVYFKE